MGAAYSFVCRLVVGALTPEIANWLVSLREGLRRCRPYVIACCA
jgi:hypothetical protein